MASASQNESAARLNRHQSNSRVQEQQQLKSSSRSAVREARKEQKQQRQHQQKQDSAPQSDEAASAEETVVYFSFWVDERLAELLSTDPNVDRLLADIETTCGCSILVDHRYQKQAELQHQNLQQQQSKTGVSVPVEVLMNESGGDFPASARRLADLVCSLGGSWRVRR
uniref:Photolyase/cryptochrome alpha/beta domain-containing protein n=1 Tax=Macrostomum lignano TaxID=282301 RepID=A0A1I8G4N1_9PLAT